MKEQMKLQKRLASKILKCSKNRVKLDSTKLSDIKEAITSVDIRGLIKKKIITEKPVRGISKFQARKRKKQKRKGRQRGLGSRKGTFGARSKPKKVWMNTIRAQRTFLKILKSKELLASADYRKLYLKAKGGFFRSVRHIKLYIKDKELIKK